MLGMIIKTAIVGAAFKPIVDAVKKMLPKTEGIR